MNEIINTANGITFLRLLLMFPCAYFYWKGQIVLSLVLFIIFVFMDIADGYVARRYNQETLFGKNLDVIADVIGAGLVIAVSIIKDNIPALYLKIIIVPFSFYALLILVSIWSFKDGFINARWKAYTATFFYGSILLFMLGGEGAISLAYLLLIYFVIAVIKYFLEMREHLKKKRENN